MKMKKIWLLTFFELIWGVCAQNFSPLALKLREEIEDEGKMYCKNAKFLTTHKDGRSKPAFLFQPFLPNLDQLKKETWQKHITLF